MELTRKTRRKYLLTALDTFEQQLTRYAARMVHGNQDLASDAVQYTFMKLCEQTTRKPENQLKAWLFTVCRNRVIDELRKNGRIKSLDRGPVEWLHSRAVDPAISGEDQEYLINLKQQIEKLPDRDREIVDLWSHGFKHHEIAEITSQKTGTVRVQLHRTLKSLKDAMGRTTTVEMNRE